MSDYRIFETSQFRRDLGRLGAAERDRIAGTLERRLYPILKTTPRQLPGAARLRDWDVPTWRLRIGAWRVFYEIDDAKRIVFLIAVDHRKDAYR